MKNHLFARIMRASGRLLLFVGAIFGFGLTFVSAYSFIYRINHPEVHYAPIKIQDTPITGVIPEQSDPFIAIALTIAIVALVIVLFWIIAKIYNNHMRSIIARIARLFHAQIFTVEVVATLIVWTVCTLYLIFTIPFLSIVTIFAFLINELLFIFAWGAYGQPDYKL